MADPRKRAAGARSDEENERPRRNGKKEAPGLRQTPRALPWEPAQSRPSDACMPPSAARGGPGARRCALRGCRPRGTLPACHCGRRGPSSTYGWGMALRHPLALRAQGGRSGTRFQRWRRALPGGAQQTQMAVQGNTRAPAARPPFFRRSHLSSSNSLKKITIMIVQGSSRSAGQSHKAACVGAGEGPSAQPRRAEPGPAPRHPQWRPQWAPCNGPPKFRRQTSAG